MNGIWPTQPVNVGMMPFFSGNEPNSDFLFTVPQYYMGINSKLEQPGNEEKLQRVKEILGWLSTVEGQTAIMDSEALAISHVRGVPWKNTSFFQAARQPCRRKTDPPAHAVPKLCHVGRIFTAGNTPPVSEGTLAVRM